MLTLITCPRCVCQVPPLHSLHFPHGALWKEVTTCSSHLRGQDSALLPWGQSTYLHKLFGIFLHRRFVSFPPLNSLFIHLFMSIWTREYLFYVSSYCPVIHYSFLIAQIFPALGIGSYLSWLLFFWHTPSPCGLSSSRTFWFGLSISLVPGTAKGTWVHLVSFLFQS